MDKYEYKVRSEEIKRLIVEGDYVQAAEIADTIDWRRVKSIMMLCTVSDLYKINRRYEDAKNMLLLAYERRQGGRTICYSLCELCIKTGDFVQAVNYYKEFVQAAPRDSGRYILQYKIYEAQDVSLEERIGVLEELKKRDYREKWAYELAYLYHRVGLATRCVEECDELILWFGEGKYVVKAMELKMLHQPLTAAQQEVYDHRFDQQEQAEEDGQADGQDGLAEGETYEEENEVAPSESEDLYQQQWQEADNQDAMEEYPEDMPEELDIQVKTMDVGKFNTINLQEELAAGLQEVLGAEEMKGFAGESSEEEVFSPLPESLPMPEERETEDDEVEVFFGETGEIRDVPLGELQKNAPGETLPEESPLESVLPEEPVSEVTLSEESVPEGALPEESVLGSSISEKSVSEGSLPKGAAVGDSPSEESVLRGTSQQKPAWEENVAPEERAEEQAARKAEAEPVRQDTGRLVMEQMRREAGDGEALDPLEQSQPPKEMAAVLSQEANGQIRLVMPENVALEKQITGQMNIQDILSEWERMKKENEERCREEVRQHVLQQTGPMFTEFEAAIRDGLLEKLETAAADEELPEEELLASDGYWEDKAYSEDGETALEDLEAEGEVLEGDFGELEPELQDIEDELPEESEDGLEEEAYEEEPEELEPEPQDIEDEFLEESEDGLEEEAYEEEPEELESELQDIEDELLEESEDGLEEEEAYEEEPEELEPESQDIEDELLEESEDGLEEEEEAYEEEPEELEPELQDIEDELLEESEDGFEESEDDLSEESENFEEGVQGSQESKSGKGGMSAKPAAGKKSRALREEKDKQAKQPIERDRAKVRALTREEKELYAPFIQNRRSREQLVKAIDNVSMAAYTGNIVITGEEGMDTLTLAKNMIREVQMADSNFSGKVAKITGQGLNQRNVRKTLEEMNGGALIIYKASGMNPDTARNLYRSLQQERLGIIVVLEDTKKAVQKLFLGTPELVGAFTARVDMEALSNDMLVLFGKRYAREMEFSIDELGVLALHTRIEELQTIDHVVTVVDVKKIVDEAIHHASRKTLGHFFDVLFARRYDEEDMIILTEKDFVA